MGKIMFAQKSDAGEMNLVSGSVSYVRGHKKGGGLSLGLSLDTVCMSTGELGEAYLDIGAWDSESRQMASQVREANVSKGKFASFLVGKIEKGLPKGSIPRYNSFLIDFQYSRYWSIDDSSGVITGVVKRVFDRDADTYTVAIPISRDSKTSWYGVTFTNTPLSRLADSARGALVENVPCAILCGKLAIDEKDGKKFRNMPGFDFVTGS